MQQLSPKESVEGADTVLRGSMRAPEGFSEGKPKAGKTKGSFNLFCLNLKFKNIRIWQILRGDSRAHLVW